MKKLFASTLIAASAATFMSSGVQAQPSASITHNVAVKPAPHDKMMHRYEALGLTEAQKAQIRTIMQSKQENGDREQMRAERQQMQQQIEALTQSRTLDTQALESMAQQHGERSKQKFIQRIKTQHAIAQVLTPEQREKMATMKAQKRHNDKPHGPHKNDAQRHL